eukprot:gene10732-biopygen2927
MWALANITHGATRRRTAPHSAARRCQTACSATRHATRHALRNTACAVPFSLELSRSYLAYRAFPWQSSSQCHRGVSPSPPPGYIRVTF